MKAVIQRGSSLLGLRSQKEKQSRVSRVTQEKSNPRAKSAAYQCLSFLRARSHGLPQRMQRVHGRSV